MPKTAFTPEEVAQAIGRNLVTIYRHIRGGKLPASKPGGAYIITRSDLAEYLGTMERVDSLFGRSEDN